MNKLNCKVVEQPVQCPASPVASQAMLDFVCWAAKGTRMKPDGLGSPALSLQKIFSVSGQELVGELQGAKAVTAGLGMRGVGTNPPPCISCSAAVQSKPARRQRSRRHFLHQ